MKENNKENLIMVSMLNNEMSYLTTKPKDYSWIAGVTLMILFVIALALSIN